MLAMIDDNEKQKEVKEEYHLKNRLNYAKELPGAQEIKNEYITWEQSKEGKERERLYIYRKSGKLVLTWGWFLEALQKEPGNMAEDIDRNVLKIISKNLKQNLRQDPELYKKMITTIVFTLFVYPNSNRRGRLSEVQHRMLERIQEMFPYLWDDICEYPEIISQMQHCENVPYDFGIYCMKKWKEDAQKEKEIGKFIRYGNFFDEQCPINTSNKEHLKEMLVFMEDYVKESCVLQESYAFRLISKVAYQTYIHSIRHQSFRNEMDEIMNCIKEHYEIIEKKGINLLESFFQYKRTDKTWDHADGNRINTFLEMRGEKEYSLKVDEVEEYVKEMGMDMNFDVILERCKIEIQDKSKVYLFQIAMGIYSSEEDMVKYYRKNLFPKEMIPKLILKLRKEKKIEKIPLLLQWMYEEEENVYS